MVMAIRVMSSGKGYEYLLHSVVVGDGDRGRSQLLRPSRADDSGTRCEGFGQPENARSLDQRVRTVQLGRVSAEVVSWRGSYAGDPMDRAGGTIS